MRMLLVAVAVIWTRCETYFFKYFGELTFKQYTGIIIIRSILKLIANNAQFYYCYISIEQQHLIQDLILGKMIFIYFIELEILNSFKTAIDNELHSTRYQFNE